jgi:hypothetical protein
MESASVGKSLNLAKEFVKNPATIYHHYVLKGGLKDILTQSYFRSGDGTASFGGGRAVRAWIGEISPEAMTNTKTPIIEFTTTEGLIPSVRLYMSRPGAYWTGDGLKVNIKAIYLPDGSILKPSGSGGFEMANSRGASKTISAAELPE